MVASEIGSEPGGAGESSVLFGDLGRYPRAADAISIKDSCPAARCTVAKSVQPAGYIE
jgi:hypothetical protein